MNGSRLVFTPLSYTGWGSLSNLIPELEKHGAKNVLVITDPALQEIGLVSKVTDPLEKKGFSIEIYSDIVPEPPLETGEKLVAFTREGDFDLVIGLGGGSALDLAKLAAVLCVHEGSVESYLNLSETNQIQFKGLPKILIPTTSGTGSEVTNISVLSLKTTKDVVAHDYLLADAAIVDPELTVSLPPRVTAATGIDALTHAIESYVSIHANPVTEGLSLHAIRLISRSIQDAVGNGDNKEARIDMSYGSFLAGLAFFNAGVAGVHALAYPLGGQFHIPHGESNAVLLPYVMAYIRESCSKKLANILHTMGSRPALASEEEASILCAEKLKQLAENTGIPVTLKGFHIQEEALEVLTKDAIKQKRLLERSPMKLGEKEIQKIYQSAYNGTLSF
ncbi:iron-containing alcohol dehydrogenase [Metabacillus sp. RGM 3146]|uniref:iron-containing alcohol dehydrogenase n=1 Tax=Metabacillus sp. RGM 3146 TaxID=3401092 RepID=UPI003B9B66B6